MRPSSVRRGCRTRPGRPGVVTSRCATRVRRRFTVTAPVTVLLLPTWSIVDSRIWKAQIAFLARHHRVHHLRRPRHRCVVAADRAAARLPGRRVRRRHGRGARRHGHGTGRAGRILVRCQLGRPGRRRSSRAGARGGGDRAVVRARDQPHRRGTQPLGNRTARVAGRLADLQPGLLAGRARRRVPGVLLHRDVLRNRTPPSRSRTPARVVLGDRRGDARRHHRGAPGGRRDGARDPRRVRRPRPLPGRGDPRQRGPHAAPGAPANGSPS